MLYLYYTPISKYKFTFITTIKRRKIFFIRILIEETFGKVGFMGKLITHVADFMVFLFSFLFLFFMCNHNGYNVTKLFTMYNKNNILTFIRSYALILEMFFLLK